MNRDETAARIREMFANADKLLANDALVRDQSQQALAKLRPSLPRGRWPALAALLDIGARRNAGLVALRAMLTTLNAALEDAV